MFDKITTKPEAPAKPCAVCRADATGEAWDTPLCAGHYGELMAGNLLTAGSIEANVPTKPWSPEGLAVTNRESLLERYRREFDAEAKKRVAKWVGERKTVRAA
jgi:hypothetical protein